MGRGRKFGVGVALVALVLLAAAATAGAATIKGRVTNEGGNPIEGITVCAEGLNLSYAGGCDWGTDAEGRYAIEGISEASYHVSFHVESNANLNYVPQWYGGAAHPEEGALVAATGGLLENVNATMRTGGQIVGTVTDAGTGLPLEGVEVCAHQVGYFEDGEITYCRRTDAAGTYGVKNLGTGSYRVEFRTESGPNYQRANYGSEVAVTAGQVTAGIDIGLSAGLQIEGELTDAATGGPAESLFAPFSGLSVCALDPLTEARVACTWPEADGHYALAGLPVGDYVIAFALDRIEEGVDFPDGYVRRFWDEAQNFGEATPVGSATPTVISGIDAAISRGEEILPPGVRLAGTFGAPSSSPGEVAPPVTIAASTHAKPSPRVRCKKGFHRVTKSGGSKCVKVEKKPKKHRRRKHRQEGGAPMRTEGT
jgi:hypothetical protein